MKNKGILAIATIIGVLAIAVFLLWQNKDSVQEPNRSPSQDSTIAPTDYSVLEKDQLYTEEEGKYANLNETGKKLLRGTLMRPECISNPNEAYCGNEQTVSNSSIISINNGYALLRLPNFKGGYVYKIYDLNNKRFVASDVDSFGAVIRTEKVLILVGIKELWKYRVGERSITIIENSEIQKDETYFRSAGLGYAEVDSTIQDSLLTLSVFSLLREAPMRGGLTAWEKIREVTFDLNNL